jgi:hypothetical protein
MSINRRENFRVKDGRLITEIVRETPFAASIVNLSSSGIYTVKPTTKIRKNNLIQMEIPLPEASESIWATGEIMFEHNLKSGFGTGIRFTYMPKFHHRLLVDLIEEHKKQMLKKMLEEILWKKKRAQYASPFMAPPPPAKETTVPMYNFLRL